jgi:hypothetical protein
MGPLNVDLEQLLKERRQLPIHFVMTVLERFGSSMVLHTSGGNADADARNSAYSSAVNVTAPNSKYSKCLSVRYAAESKTLDPY